MAEALGRSERPFPPRPRRTPYPDRATYKRRNVIERLFYRRKNWRRVATETTASLETLSPASLSRRQSSHGLVESPYLKCLTGPIEQNILRSEQFNPSRRRRATIVRWPWEHSSRKLRIRHGKGFYFGNANADQVRSSGWFVGQFVAPELGLRHQTAVEVKWGVHPDGDRRPSPWANGNGTTISVLVEGVLRVTFHVDGTQEEVMLQKRGDYVVFGPDVVHSWEATGDTIVLSVRFPSVEVGSQSKPD